jgi:hypothetical protein
MISRAKRVRGPVRRGAIQQPCERDSNDNTACIPHQPLAVGDRKIGQEPDGGLWAVKLVEHQYGRWRRQSVVRIASTSQPRSMLTMASGNNANANQPATQPQSSGGLFGGSQPQPQPQQPQSASLFGAHPPPPQPQSGSLFGAALGGNSQPPTQMQAPAQSGGLL